MAQIMVTSNPDERGRPGEVVYQERIHGADVESNDFKALLLQRLRWAIGDARAAECLRSPGTGTVATYDGLAAPSTPGDAHGL